MPTLSAVARPRASARRDPSPKACRRTSDSMLAQQRAPKAGAARRSMSAERAGGSKLGEGEVQGVRLEETGQCELQSCLGLLNRLCRSFLLSKMSAGASGWLARPHTRMRKLAPVARSNWACQLIMQRLHHEVISRGYINRLICRTRLLARNGKHRQPPTGVGMQSPASPQHDPAKDGLALQLLALAAGSAAGRCQTCAPHDLLQSCDLGGQGAACGRHAAV